MQCDRKHQSRSMKEKHKFITNSPSKSHLGSRFLDDDDEVLSTGSSTEAAEQHLIQTLLQFLSADKNQDPETPHFARFLDLIPGRAAGGPNPIDAAAISIN